MRRELLDLEAQVTEANAAEREESCSAARFDRTTYRRVGVDYYDADRVPHESDVEWGDES